MTSGPLLFAESLRRRSSSLLHYFLSQCTVEIISKEVEFNLRENMSQGFLDEALADWDLIHQDLANGMWPRGSVDNEEVWIAISGVYLDQPGRVNADGQDLCAVLSIVHRVRTLSASRKSLLADISLVAISVLRRQELQLLEAFVAWVLWLRELVDIGSELTAEDLGSLASMISTCFFNRVHSSLQGEGLLTGIEEFVTARLDSLILANQ